MVDIIPPSIQLDKTQTFIHLIAVFCVAMISWFFIFIFLPFIYRMYKETQNGQ